jgi:hypothetical protein
MTEFEWNLSSYALISAQGDGQIYAPCMAGTRMPHLPEDKVPENWHRYFAMKGNNRAWELAALRVRTAGQDEEMLNAGHAAAFHWNLVGTELHAMRAKLLLAEVHALLGMGPSAWALASEVRSYFLGRETDDWELAFVHSIHAHAAAAAGMRDPHRESWALAKSAVEAISDPEDREIVRATFDQVPVP